MAAPGHVKWSSSVGRWAELGPPSCRLYCGPRIQGRRGVRLHSCPQPCFQTALLPHETHRACPALLTPPHCRKHPRSVPRRDCQVTVAQPREVRNEVVPPLTGWKFPLRQSSSAWLLWLFPKKRRSPGSLWGRPELGGFLHVAVGSGRSDAQEGWKKMQMSHGATAY